MKYLRFALFPFAVLYELAVRVRNHLYDIGNKKTTEFDLPVVCVGNLVAGGSGKTPMVEYLVRLLRGERKIGTLSRGYGRKTRGFRMAGAEDNHLTIGDEPFQMYRKFGSEVKVAVGEERALAIPEILYQDPAIDLIILDDAFQHRAVKATINILLTDFSKPFYEDHILPVGMLREPRAGAKRADFVVVTKCPEGLSLADADIIRSNISRYTKRNVPVFFSSIKYGEMTAFTSREKPSERILVLTGIANPKPFISFLQMKYEVAEVVSFPDHHKFSESDIKKILKFAENGEEPLSVVTTEKDYVRLLQFREQILQSEISFFYVPIVSSFLFEENKFEKMISDAIIAFERKTND